MTITARYASRCASCGQAVTPGQQIEWTKGSPARHTDCQSPAAAPVASVSSSKRPRYRPTRCAECGARASRYVRIYGYTDATAMCGGCWRDAKEEEAMGC
jgi:uncharacterized OB-fold protein